jgi:hypothetical protein
MVTLGKTRCADKPSPAAQGGSRRQTPNPTPIASEKDHRDPPEHQGPRVMTVCRSGLATILFW